MGETVDARGLACPQPVVLTKQALEHCTGELTVMVDNPTARITSHASPARRAGVKVQEEDYGFRLEITPGACKAVLPGSGSECVFVLSADFMGKVDSQLGHVLIKAFLNTLADRDSAPSHLVLFNTGVALACGEADTVGPLKRLESRGVTILACGTCLDFLDLKEELEVGMVSNMYEIVDTLAGAERCITI